MTNTTQTEQTVQENKMIKRFSLKLETKLLTALNKVLSEQQNCWSEDEAIQKNIVVMDSSNVTMFIALSEEAKRVLNRFVDKEKPEQRIPDLKYSEGHSSKYSTNYFVPIINIFKAFDSCKEHSADECFKLSVANDFPATFENKHFKIILAPRVQNY